jgi:phospholipid transport system transporter-binding protein
MKTELLETNDGLSLIVSGELSQLTLQKDCWINFSSQDKAKVVDVDKLTIDLEKVERVDTAGLAWLLNLKRDLKSHKVASHIKNSPKKLLELATLSNIQTVLTQSDDKA